MTDIINSYLEDGIVSFAFPKIDTYINNNGEEKKKPIGMPSWTTINKDNCFAYNQGSAFAILTGEQSNLTVFDFDKTESYNNLVNKHPELKKYKTIKTKKGFHIWFYYNKAYETTTDCMVDYQGVDIRNDKGVIFCPPTKYFSIEKQEFVTYEDLGGELKEVPEYMMDYIKKPKPVSTDNKKPITTQTQSTQKVKNDIVDKVLYLGLLDGKANGSWDDWRDVGLAMKHCTTYDHFLQFSKINTNKFDENETLNFWNSIKEVENGLSIGSLMMWARDYDNDKYNLYFDYYIPLSKLTKGSLNIAEVIAPKLMRHLKFCREKWFVYDEKTHLWSVVKEPSQKIIKMVHKHIDYSINSLSNKLQKTTDEEEQKKLRDQMTDYTQFYKTVDSSSNYSMISKHLKTLLNDADFENKLDNNPYYIAFANGIYDLKTKTFRHGFNDCDYLTRTIDYDYEKSTQEERDFMMNVFKKICNWNEDHLNYYLSVFGYSMLGDAELEKSMYFMVGQGGNNGKTLILDALAEDIMPCYVTKLERMTFEDGYSKAHKHLISTKGMRIAYIEELRKNKKMNESLLKEFADGKTIKNEVMFGTNETINIMCKLFALSNHTPQFDNDGGTGNRYNQLQFNSNFNKENTEDNYEKLSFIRDNKLAEKIKNQYKLAVCDILFEYAYRYTIDNKLYPMPKEFIEATKETININSHFKNWFEDNCELNPNEKTGKNELVEASRMSFRELNDELKNIGFKYDKGIRVNGVRGGWIGFKMNLQE